MKLYVYCLAENTEDIGPPADTLKGVSGAPVDVLQVERLSLLVSEFNDEKVVVNRDNALAHAAVVASVLNQTTPLPFRFGTVSDEQRLRSYLASHRQALEAKLEHVRGAVEMSVKIIWDAEANVDSSADGPGARFLRAKQLRAARGKEVADWLREQLQPIAKDEQLSLSPTEKLIVAAAHLVDRGLVTEYRGRLAKAREMRPELHFLISGPWPPYSFANIDLEFKTRFGVS